MALLFVKNTTGNIDPEAGTGLGSRLINAFSRQLNGQVEIIDEEGTYTLSVEFHVPLQAKEVYDY
jgi:two-component sensor histidine kinase